MKSKLVPVIFDASKGGSSNHIILMCRESITCYFDFFSRITSPFSYYITLIPYYTSSFWYQFHFFAVLPHPFGIIFTVLTTALLHGFCYYLRNLGLKNWTDSHLSRNRKARHRLRAALSVPFDRHVTSQYQEKLHAGTARNGSGTTNVFTGLLQIKDNVLFSVFSFSCPHGQLFLFGK